MCKCVSMWICPVCACMSACVGWCAFCSLYQSLHSQLYHITTLCNMQNVSFFSFSFLFFLSLWGILPFRMGFGMFPLGLVYTPDTGQSNFYEYGSCVMKQNWIICVTPHIWKLVRNLLKHFNGDMTNETELIYFVPDISCALHLFALHAVDFTLSNCKTNKDDATFYWTTLNI